MIKKFGIAVILFIIPLNLYASHYTLLESLKQISQTVNSSFNSQDGLTIESQKLKKPVDLSEISDGENTIKSDTLPKKSDDAQQKESFFSFIFSIDLKHKFFQLREAILIILCSFCLWRIINYVVQRSFTKIRLFKKISEQTSASTQSMIKTALPIIKSIIHWALIILTSLMVLRVFFDITPIFFGIGVAGIALTIGSQTLIKGFVNGILLLFDGNVAVGDVVTIGSQTGTVESISLRAILLRHFTGELQTIPLSEVSGLINCSRDYSFAVIEFVVNPKALIESIELAMKEAFDSIKNDSQFQMNIIGELSSLGVKKMSEVGVVMCAKVMIKPDPRKIFISEFNKRFYEYLQKHDVPLAYIDHV